LSFRDAWSSLIVANRSRFGAHAATEDYQRQETMALWESVSRKLTTSIMARSTPRDWAAVIADHAIKNTGHEPEGPVWQIVTAAALELIAHDGLIAKDLPPVPAHPTLEQGVALRAFLRQKEAFLDDVDRYSDLWCGFAENVFGGVIEKIPSSAFEGQEDEAAFQVRMIDVLEDPGSIIQALMGTLQSSELASANLFRPILERMWLNVCRVSKIDPADFAHKQHKLILPSKADMSPAALVDNYLDGTPFTGFFRSSLPFRIPLRARFEHTHIVGGTGHGKTQLLQLMIYRDLLKAAEGKGFGRGDRQPGRPHPHHFAPGALRSRPRAEPGRQAGADRPERRGLPAGAQPV